MIIYRLIVARLVKKHEQEMIINNAMVILLTISFYDDDADDPNPQLGHLPDLQLDQDIPNLTKLFGSENLNYTIYPTYDTGKMHWTKKEIISFLQARAKELNDNIENNEVGKFDGLVVAIRYVTCCCF